MGDIFVGLLFLAIGGLTLFLSITNSDALLDPRRANFIVSTFGREKARIIYIAIGVILIGASIFSFV